MRNFGVPGLNGFRHAAELLDFANLLPTALGQIVREPFDEVTATPDKDRPHCRCRFPAAGTIACYRAIREKSDGSAKASSKALVWSDCVCPWAAAIASTQVRITLL